MNKSEQLRRQAAEEDNDLKALALEGQGVREERKDRFETDWLPKLKDKLGKQIYYDKEKYFYTITGLPNGAKTVKIADYYPKANKLLVRADNKWYKPGLHWLIKIFLKLKTCLTQGRISR